MSYSLTWLPDVLRNAGLAVQEHDGWKDHGHGDVGRILGVICHHTGTATPGAMPTLNVLINGVTQGKTRITGPLAQLGLGRDGTYHVIAAGKAYHAGTGSWQKLTNGNANFIGIEAENSGAEPWPDMQLEAYRKGVAAILEHVDRAVEFCAGHKEYALPRGRKDDPSFDMDVFRDSVAELLGVTSQPTLKRGSTGPAVRRLQELLHIDTSQGGAGTFGPRTEAAVKAFQTAHGLNPDGIAGPETWALLDRSG
jgi:hypothetical protein